MSCHDKFQVSQGLKVSRSQSCEFVPSSKKKNVGK